MIAIASCWPPDVAAGSGTTVSQNRLLEALRLAGLEAELIYTSSFGSSDLQLAAREEANRHFGKRVAAYDAVLGIDGEGWQWAAGQRDKPFVAFCEAVLAEVLPFESGAVRDVLAKQAEWEAAAARAADAVVARSEFSTGRVAYHYGIAPERITVQPIPFDVDAWRVALPQVPKGPLVLAVGHLYPRKNYAALLRAWPMVRASVPSARLQVVGTGPEEAHLRELATQTAGARLVGHVSFEELQALYARAHVFCHPSLQENFGIAVVEGLASGAAVVTHRQPAVLESTASLPGTWAVDANEPTQLAEALIAALQAPAPWPPNRLDRLRQKIAPAKVGGELRKLIEGLRA